MTPRELFDAHLDLIEYVIASIARRHALPASERDEFRSYAFVRFIDHDYHILREYRREATLKTFLTSVVQRLFLDYRIKEWGKWHPSAEAKRLGPTAIRLETLMMRDRLTLNEACERLARESDPMVPRGELEGLAARLPQRTPRRMLDETHLPSVAVDCSQVEATVRQQELQALRAKAGRALAAALQGLPPQDRLILKLRYNERLTVVAIARLLNIKDKVLYRRLDQLHEDLHVTLEAAGISKDMVAELLNDVDGPKTTVSVVAPQGKRGGRPSHE